MSKNIRKILSALRIVPLACGIVLASAYVGLSTSLQNEPVMTQGDRQRASEAADRFLMRFRESLDFGTVFDEMGSPKAMVGLRNTGFFEEFQFNPDLTHRLDDASLRRAYKAMMNVYYLGMLYNISKCDGGKAPELPKDIKALLKESTFTGAEDTDDSRSKINTTQDLEEYVSLNETLAILYKKHLPPGAFETPAYKKKFARLDRQREKDHVAFSNYESFGIPKGSPIYLAQRDFFSIVLVAEAGETKVIRVGMGN